MFEPCIRCEGATNGRGFTPTDPIAFAGGGAVTAFQIGLGLESLDKLISRINARRESVSPGQH